MATQDSDSAGLLPGEWVALQGQESWGPGQIQSVIGNRITVNFENAGKQVIDITAAKLVAVSAINDVEEPAASSRSN